MRKFLLAVLLLVASGAAKARAQDTLTMLGVGGGHAASSGNPTWTLHTYCTHGSVSSGTSVGCTLKATPSAGDFEVAWVVDNDSGSVSAISDGTNSFCLPNNSGGCTGGSGGVACAKTYNSTASSVCIGYLKCASSCGTTITATDGSCGSGGCVMGVMVFTPSSAGTYDNVIASATVTSSTAMTSPQITPGHGAELMVSAGTGAGAISGVTGSWTEDPGGITSGVTAEYILSSSSATNVGYTQSSNSAWDAVGICFY